MNTIKPFYRPDLDRAIPLSDQSVESLEAAVANLNDPSILGRAATGRLTLGMIKPSLNGAFLNENYPDPQAAAILEREITGLGVASKFAVNFDFEGVDTFYDGPAKYDSMMPSAPLKNPDYANRWEEYVDFMMSGPATILLLDTKDETAIPTWRSQLGHWNIEAKRDLSTIRGRYGLDNHNNLLHGSDAPESALREISIVSDILGRAIKAKRANS